MPKLSADDRLQRLLAVVPWVAGRDGPRLEEVCARFDCREDELVDDLQMLFLCGLHPYTPDMLIDVDIADGRVWIRYADYFARPLRLTPAEGLGLLAAGRTLLATPGAESGGPLERGLAKLAAALGVDADKAVEI
ncbi:MAG: proteasome accessory factor, partial [Actinomycetota bacterium]|nr:proteasome accessory factor [Actinomycetota bacterium]